MGSPSETLMLMRHGGEEGRASETDRIIRSLKDSEESGGEAARPK